MLRNQEEARASWSSCCRPMAHVVAAGDSGTTWQGEEKLARVGRAGGPGGAVRAARGSGQPGGSPARGGGRHSRATEREGREKDDGDLFAIFQKFKGFTVK
jgi:hypothetical protein